MLLILGLALWSGCRADRYVALDAAEDHGRRHLVVLHTNDVHGQVLPRTVTPPGREEPVEAGGLARVAERVQRLRAELADEPGTGVLVLDGGDWFQGTPEGLVDGGAAFLRALDAVGYDALAVGNHEFDLGLPHLRDLLEEVAPAAIAANLRDPQTGERVAWVEPWRVVETAGLRVALVGLVTTQTPSITHPDAKLLDFSDPVEEFARARDELGAEPGLDLILPVGHVGVGAGRRIAEAFDDVPLVVTGHSHTYLREGLRAGNGLIVQAGDKATVLGRVDLWLERGAQGDWAVVESSATLLQLEEDVAGSPHANAEVERLCADLVARAEAAMGGVVGTLTAPLTRGRGPGSSVAGNWVSDLMRARTGADVAVHNRGGTRRDVEAGPVTQRDVYELLPFDNDLATLELSGSELAGLVRRSLEGSGAGRLDFSGLRATTGSAASAELAIEVGGRPLDPGRRYTVTTNSFLARGGDGYTVFEAAPRIGHDPTLLRELALEAFARQGAVTPPSDERIGTGSGAAAPAGERR